MDYGDVIMIKMASQITSLAIVYSTVYSAKIKENIRAPRHWPLCREFTGTGEFPAQTASNAENVSIWWRHHGCRSLPLIPYVRLIVYVMFSKAGSKLAPSQWATSLQSNTVSHWLGANLESTLCWHVLQRKATGISQSKFLIFVVLLGSLSQHLVQFQRFEFN